MLPSRLAVLFKIVFLGRRRGHWCVDEAVQIFRAIVKIAVSFMALIIFIFFLFNELVLT